MMISIHAALDNGTRVIGFPYYCVVYLTHTPKRDSTVYNTQFARVQY